MGRPLVGLTLFDQSFGMILSSYGHHDFGMILSSYYLGWTRPLKGFIILDHPLG